MNLARRHPWNRRGVTLIELLVVVSILVMLAAVALPQVQPMMETRRGREAARAINVYFGSARTRAIETGRPCGVILQRFGTNRNAVTTLQMVEVPTNYSGHTENAQMRLTWDGSVDGNGYATVVAALVDSSSVISGTIRQGDRIQFNHQGPWYTVSGVGTGGSVDASGCITAFPIKLKTYLSSGATLPWDSTPSAPLPFNVARQPYDSTTTTLRMRRSAAASLTLPAGVAIDLGVSGTETYAGQFGEPDPSLSEAVLRTRPVIIIFSPTGSVERVISIISASPPNNWEFTPTEPLYLMVGKIGQINMPEEAPPPNPIPDGWKPTGDALPNWLDPDSLWISLQPRTGLVSVAENGYLDTPAQQSGVFEWDKQGTWQAAVEVTRRFARAVQMNQGGR